MPLGPFRAESGLQRFAAHQQLKLARSARRPERRRPIPRADPNAILARGRYVDSRHGILDRPPQPVSQQHGRAHLIHVLLVDHPTAGTLEPLGFDQNGPPVFHCEQSAPEAQNEVHRGGSAEDDTHDTLLSMSLNAEDPVSRCGRSTDQSTPPTSRCKQAVGRLARSGCIDRACAWFRMVYMRP